MCKQLAGTNQRCFTWAGPFGGGKSSLVVALASALHPDRCRTNLNNCGLPQQIARLTVRNTKPSSGCLAPHRQR